MKRTLFVTLLVAGLIALCGCSSPSVVVNTTTKVDFSKAYLGTHTAVIPIGTRSDAGFIEGVLNAFETQEHVRITSWDFSTTQNSGGVDTGGTGSVKTSLLVTFVRESDETTSTRY